VLNVRTICCTATLVAIFLSLGWATQPAHGQGGTNVAVIDVPFIFKNYSRFKADIEKIKTDIDAFKDLVTDQQKRLRAEMEKLEQFKPGTREYEQQEEAIARMKMEFQLEGAKRQKEFMDREAEVYFNAYRQIEAAVQEFAARNRIGLVLRYSAEEMDPTKRETIMQGINRIVIYQDRLNITQYIVDMLERKDLQAPGQVNGNAVPAPPGVTGRPAPVPNMTNRTGPQIPVRQ
jgi:outer membrane protein